MDSNDQAWNALCNVQQRESLKHSRIAKVTQKLNEKLEREQFQVTQALPRSTPEKPLTTIATSGSQDQVRSKFTQDIRHIVTQKSMQTKNLMHVLSVTCGMKSVNCDRKLQLLMFKTQTTICKIIGSLGHNLAHPIIFPTNFTNSLVWFCQIEYVHKV